MRLTCPNCGAEYEASDGMVPPAGRHVQCTACHTRWFVRGRPGPASARTRSCAAGDLVAAPAGRSPVPDRGADHPRLRAATAEPATRRRPRPPTPRPSRPRPPRARAADQAGRAAAGAAARPRSRAAPPPRPAPRLDLGEPRRARAGRGAAAAQPLPAAASCSSLVLGAPRPRRLPLRATPSPPAAPPPAPRSQPTAQRSTVCATTRAAPRRIPAATQPGRLADGDAILAARMPRAPARRARHGASSRRRLCAANPALHGAQNRSSSRRR